VSKARRRSIARSGAAARGPWLRSALLLVPLLLAPALPAAAAEPDEDALPPRLRALGLSAREVLSRAFDNFYGCDLQERVEFNVTGQNGKVFRFEAERLRKRIDGRVHDVFSVRGGTDRREFRSLRIQGRAGDSDDIFAYVPELLRVRRVNSARRGDAFFGSHLSLSDLEVQYVERMEFVGRATAEVNGEPAYLVTTQPLYESGYDRADFFVAMRDYALLEIRFYRPGETEAFKVAHMPRENTELLNGHALPSRMVFQHLPTGTQTELRFHERLVNPELEDAMFTITSLESRRRLNRAKPEPPAPIEGE
jgi:hypothetical protein